MKIRIPLGVKFGIITMSALILTMLLSTYLVTDRFHKTTMNIINEEFEQTMTLVENYFDLLEQSNYFFANSLSQDKRLKALLEDGSEQQIQGYLEAQREAMRLDEIVILDRQGDLMRQTGFLPFSGVNINHHDLVHKSFEQKRFFSGILRQEDTFSFYTTALIKTDEKIEALVMVGLGISNRMMEGIRKNTTMELSIVGDRVMAATSIRQDGEAIGSLPVNYLRYLWLLEDSTRILSSKIDGNEYFIKARNLKQIDNSTNASLMLAYDNQYYHQGIEELQTLQYKLQAATLFFILLVVSLLGHHLQRHFSKLISGMNRVRTGKYDQIVEMPTGDELETLSNHFNVMTHAIATQEEQLKAYASSLEGEVKKRTAEISLRNGYLQAILDQQSTMIIAIENDTISFTNRYFLDFFDAASLDEYRDSYEWGLLLGCHSEQDKQLGINHCIHDVITRPEDQQQVILTTLTGEQKVFQLHITKIHELSYLITLQDITTFKTEEERLYTQATRDQLTGLLNRHNFDDLFEQIALQAEHTKQYIAFVLADIDDFKKINDIYGHQVGDDTLVTLASLLREHTRKNDLLVRWGGEEFVIVMLTNSLKQAQVIMEKLRIHIADHRFEHIDHLSCSLGLTLYHKDETVETLFSRADEALYSAKSKGKNRVELR